MDFPLKNLLSLCLPVCESVCLCLSVCLSVLFTPLSLCSHHGIIMKFSEVITNVRSDVYAKVQGQKSKVKVTEVKTQISRFGTITPVWFRIWWWNDAQSLILFKSGALVIFKVICQISRSHGKKNRRFRPKLRVLGRFVFQGYPSNFKVTGLKKFI